MIKGLKNVTHAVNQQTINTFEKQFENKNKITAGKKTQSDKKHTISFNNQVANFNIEKNIVSSKSIQSFDQRPENTYMKEIINESKNEIFEIERSIK